MITMDECNRLGVISGTRDADIQHLRRYLRKRMSVLLYGPRGIGKKTLIDCLALGSTRKEFDVDVHFFRVDLDTRYLDKWSHEECRWKLDEDSYSARATQSGREPTTNGGSEDVIPQVGADDEELTNKIASRSTSLDQNILVDHLLDRLDRKLADQVSSDYSIVYLGGFKSLPLSGFTSLQIGKLQQWIRQGVSLILISPENLAETSGRFGDLYQKDVQKWVRYAVGLLPTEETALDAARLLYKMPQDAQPTDELLKTLIEVAGPHPGQIAFALENPESDRLNDTADKLKDNLLRRFKEYQDYQDSYQVIWTRLEPQEKQYLATVALVQLHKADNQDAAKQDLSERRPDWLSDAASYSDDEIKIQLSSPRRRTGQLLLPWKEDRTYSEAFAEFIVRQLPQRVQEKRTDRMFRRDVMLFFVSLVTLFGFVSIFLSLIDNWILISIIVLLLSIALLALIVYAILLVIRLARS